MASVAAMGRLTFDTYLSHLETESARFREVLGKGDPHARVPSCPDWDAADLLWHLTDVQDSWAAMVDGRPEAVMDGHTPPPRPASYDDLVSLFDERSAALAAALRAADPAEYAWTWSADRTVGFIARRQAHEALIHRLDAEETTGAVTELDPMLASDGVEEALGVMHGGTPPWGRFAPDGSGVRVRITDTGEEVLVALGRFTGTDPDDGTAYDLDDIGVVEALDSPAVTVSGTAGDLDTWLWHRGARVEARIGVDGDRATYDRFRACVDQPIN
jgi:uncharacterized protein (TIGR03083 family)